MKKLLIVIAIILFVENDATSQTPPDGARLNILAPVILNLSDTTRYKGRFINARVFIEDGYILYQEPADTSATYLEYYYFNINKKPLDKKYRVWNSTPR